jgi:hypothetical protein
MADRSLSAAYPKVRTKSPAKFASENGSWKPFAEVKSELAKLHFSEVFQAIKKLEKKEEWTDGLFAQYRLLPATRAAYKDLRIDPEHPKWILENSSEQLADQFKLERKELPIQRTSQEKWMKEKAFVMMPSDWSPIRVPPNGELSFFYLIDKKPCENPVLDHIAFGKESIAADAERFLAEKLIESLLQHNSIILPKEFVE